MREDRAARPRAGAARSLASLRRALHALGVVRAHPRQLVLAAGVAGLLLAPVWRPGVPLAAVVLAVVAGRLPLALLVALAALAGGVTAEARLAALDETELGPVIGRSVSMDVILLEQPRASARPGPAWLGGPVRRALARVARGRGEGERVVLRVPGRVRWRGAQTGAVLRVRGRVRTLGEWDAHQRRRGAHAVLEADALIASGRRRGGIAGALDGVRGRAERGLAAGLSAPQAALLRGMVLGQDEHLSEPEREEFRRSGLAHLLAASGQNVTLLAVLALGFLALTGASLPVRLACVLVLIAAYVPLAGGGASIQRAGIMGAAGVVAALAGRPASRWHAVLLAALATLLLNPRAAADPGWQLSFAAIVAILLLARPMADGLARGREEKSADPDPGGGGTRGRARREVSVRLSLPRPVAEVAAVTLSATLGTAPLIAYHFERVLLASVPANLLAAPAVAPVMWLGMLSAVAGQLATAPAAVINALCAYPLGYLSWLAHVAAQAPGASLPLRLSSPIALALAYAALVAVLAAGAACWARGMLARAALPVGVALLLAVLVVLPGRGRAAPPAGLRVSFLAVGQGDATLLQHGERAVLVDAGPPGGPVVALLERAGVRRLDALVITHDQADHDGAAAAVLARFAVGTLVDGGEGPPSPPRRALLAVAARKGIRRIVPEAGQSIRAGPLRLDVLWPRRDGATPPTGADPNQRALVVVARDGPFDALLPADAESEVTAALDLPRVEVVKVAHHGSDDPGLPALLERARPQIAVVPVGRNTYGHPTAQALEALRAGVPRVYRTDRDGTVRLDVSAGRVVVSTER